MCVCVLENQDRIGFSLEIDIYVQKEMKDPRAKQSLGNVFIDRKEIQGT